MLSQRPRKKLTCKLSETDGGIYGHQCCFCRRRSCSRLANNISIGYPFGYVRMPIEKIASLSSLQHERVPVLGRRYFSPFEGFSPEQKEVIRRIRQSKGKMCPGNHDETLRGHFGHYFGGVQIVPDAIHTTADGRRFLVIHGDLFDKVVTNVKWLAWLGSIAYALALQVNSVCALVRHLVGLPYWSFSAYVKRRIKLAVNFISNFEQCLAAEARRRGVDGVICGHIHYAELRAEADGFHYINTGDWVESCTAVVEDFDGNLYLIRWEEETDDAQQEVGCYPRGDNHADPELELEEMLAFSARAI